MRGSGGSAPPRGPDVTLLIVRLRLRMWVTAMTRSSLHLASSVLGILGAIVVVLVAGPFLALLALQPPRLAALTVPVFTAVTAKFTQDAPKLTDFLSKVKVPLDVMNQTMAYMEKNEAEPQPTAMWFLKNQQAVWTGWLPADVTERVKAAL